MSTDSFPRRSALTRGFRLGAPRTFTISSDGSRVLFLRSRHGTDEVNALWSLEVATGIETCVADPRELASADGELPAEEKARRERAREVAGGIVTYCTDADCSRAVVTMAGQAFLVDVKQARTSPLDLPSPILDPRLDRSGRRIAFVHDNALWVHDLTGLASTSAVRLTPVESAAQITWGLADFIAAEEMDRTRGHWWDYNGTAVFVQRTDASALDELTIVNPTDPTAPMTHRYPAAGTTNASVSVHRFGLDGSSVEISWDKATYEYFVDLISDQHGQMLLVQSRDQRTLRLLAINADGSTSLIEEQDDENWVELVAGAPARLANGGLVRVLDINNNRHLTIDDFVVSPNGWDVRSVNSVDENTVVFSASPTANSWDCALWSWNGESGAQTMVSGGWNSGMSRGGTQLIASNQLNAPKGEQSVISVESVHSAQPHIIESFVEIPTVEPVIYRVETAEPLLRIAVLFPDGEIPSKPLPVLLDPYGGPHGQRVMSAASAFLTAQWWANQGFVVIVADGRGMPGSPAWEKSVHLDLSSGVLADQVSALQAVAAAYPSSLDLAAVGIRGWSFGGYLAALAVLDRPDVFHAAVAGAAVTEWRLYDTHYTERYLGDPAKNSAIYDANSLIPRAKNLTRPLLLIHGVADDNVFVSNTAQLSQALTAAGKEHQVEYLTGVTHMTPQEEVAENLLLLQLDFLKKSLD